MIKCGNLLVISFSGDFAALHILIKILENLYHFIFNFLILYQFMKNNIGTHVNFTKVTADSNK